MAEDRISLPLGKDGPFEGLRRSFECGGLTFPAIHAQIFWNVVVATGKVYQVSVCFVPRRHKKFEKSMYDDPSFQRVCMSAFSDSGNSTSTWTGSSADAARILGQTLNHGFTEHNEMVRAFSEFSRLDECDWARTMREAMRLRTGKS